MKMYKPRIINPIDKSSKFFYGVVVTKKQKGDTKNPIHYLRVYLNFAYFFCYIPFRFARLPNGNYSIHSNVIHQVACGINHLLALARFLTAIRETSSLEHAWNPSMYFELARNIATSVYMITFMMTFWTKKKLFQRIFMEIQEYYFRYIKRNDTRSSEKATSRWNLQIQITTTAWILCIIYTVISTLNVIFGAGIIEMSSWELTWLLRSYAGQGKFMIFLQSNKTAVDWDEFSPTLYLFTALQIIIQFYSKLGAHYADLCILICTLTLRNLASYFSAAIKYQNFETTQMLAHYYVLKKLAKSINSAIGPITLCAILEAMPFYATHLGDILIVPGWWGKIRYLFFVINFFSILIIAADTAHKVSEFKEWLSVDSNCSSITHSKLILLLNELTSNSVGLTAIIVTITYGFIGTLVSVVITYAVIILQFKSSVCKSPQIDPLVGD